MSKPENPSNPLTHVAQGAAGSESRMVDVGAKPSSARRALARARVRLGAGTLGGVLAGAGPKGPVTEVARVAGILAAKRTAEWIPMCHTLALDSVHIEFEERDGDVLEIRCEARCTGRTGVEMEAMVGASAAALTVYDMTKALGHGISIEQVELLEKDGGQSGLWRRAAPVGA
ncbi:MAG: cyclic pyranopterin monophosphate synthase MoaC [Planctomycetes bacterium]|nr:cyclic pyranopterin monophosphate synthase MoaC [Planctomycetota bacterium]